MTPFLLSICTLPWPLKYKTVMNLDRHLPSMDNGGVYIHFLCVQLPLELLRVVGNHHTKNAIG
jgi:hypothetical protein